MPNIFLMSVLQRNQCNTIQLHWDEWRSSNTTRLLTGRALRLDESSMSVRNCVVKEDMHDCHLQKAAVTSSGLLLPSGKSSTHAQMTLSGNFSTNLVGTFFSYDWVTECRSQALQCVVYFKWDTSVKTEIIFNMCNVLKSRTKMPNLYET